MCQNIDCIQLLQTMFTLLLLVSCSLGQNFTTVGNAVVKSACEASNEQSTTIQKTDITYKNRYLVTASLNNVQYDARLADPDSALFGSTASAFENEIRSLLTPLIQNQPPSTVPVFLDIDVILFRPSDLGQDPGLTLECILSLDTDQKTAAFLQSQLQTVASSSVNYPSFVARVSSSVTYCLRQVIQTQEGALTWPVTQVGQETGTEELCPVGTRHVGDRSLGRRSCGQSPESAGHAAWEPYVCTDCGEIINVDDALEAIYNEILHNSSIVLGGVRRAAALLNEVTGITEIGFNWVALILEYVAGLGTITTELLDAVVQLLSNLLRQDGQTFLVAEQQLRSSARMVQSLATILEITTLPNSVSEYESVHSNLAAALLDVPHTRIQNEWISFGSVVGATTDSPLSQGSVGIFTGQTLSLLPNAEAYVHIKVNGPVSTGTLTVRTMFVVYHNAKLFQSVDPQSATTTSIAGRVVSADIGATQTPELSIVTRFKPLESGVTNGECRSWDPSLSDGHGDWSRPACMREDDTDETGGRIKCRCNQLTAFTVFAERGTGNPADMSTVSPFVRVAAVLCLLCLLAAVILYLVVKELRTQREFQILCLLFTTLAMFHLILTAGIDQSGVGCMVAGALLHYCILVDLGWLGLAWVHLYDLSRRKQWPVTWFLAKVSGPVLGIPFLIVIITAVVDPIHYTSPTQRCFLSSDPIYNIIVALILPTILILVIICVAFSFTARNVVLDSDAKLDEDPEGIVNQESKGSQLWKLWQKYVLYLALTVLTILLFVFAVLMGNGSQDGAQYIFGVLAIFEGVLVIAAFCVYHRDVREAMMIKLGYINGPESKKFQPYWSTSKWQDKNRKSVLPETVGNRVGDEEGEKGKKLKKLYLDNTQGSGAQTNQGFDPTTVPLSTIEMQRMGQNGVASHASNGIVVEADYHGPIETAEDAL